jgi:hypothetical protein
VDLLPSAVTPAVVTPELTHAALASEAMIGALTLAEWVGDGKQVTAKGLLAQGPALAACRALGVATGKKRLRSAGDVPELAVAWRVARAAGLITVSGGSARGAGLEDPADALATWLRAVVAPLGLPEEQRAEWLAAVALIAEAGDGGLSAWDVRNAAFAVSDGEESDGRATQWLADWVLLGAVVPASGSPALDDVLRDVPLRVTPLGRLLADSVTAALAPAPEEDAGAVVARFGSLPVGIAIRYASGWLAARTPVAAAGELIDFAASATPHQRATAIDLAAELGPDAAQAWRQRADLPGYGAYVREWLADQGEQVPDFPGDEAWLAAETFSLGLSSAPEWLGDGKLSWAAEEAFGADDPLTVLAASGHPDAPRLIEAVEGAPGLPDAGGRPLQLLVTLDGTDIWRRVAISERATLADLHGVIQAAMGWENCHMWEFSDGRHQLDDRVPLRTVLPRSRSVVQYTYDLGDDWRHVVRSEGFHQNEPGITLPACLDGAGACPPEECGGSYGYFQLLEVLADPDATAEDFDDALSALGVESAEDYDPKAFSLDEANARMARRPRLGALGAPDEITITIIPPS